MAVSMNGGPLECVKDPLKEFGVDPKGRCRVDPYQKHMAAAVNGAPFCGCPCIKSRPYVLGVCIWVPLF